MPRERDAVITGIGLVSSLGEGPDAHWAALTAPGGARPVLDAERFAPFPVHPLVALDLDKQIPKRGDQRQMEPWQRIGVYTAGLALDHAALKGDAALLARTHMIVCAGGGERDPTVDAAVLASPDAALNAQLMEGLRPTLFLAQLSNLLAGNISIVHGVVGSSRTFMGEEAAGADAVRVACARLAAGQGDLFLVGGAQNVERPEMLLNYALGGTLLRGAHAPIRARQAQGGGIVLGSLGCFLVIESRTHAEARGVPVIATIAAITADRCRRGEGEASANAARQFDAMRTMIDPPHAAAISAASGIAAASTEELAFLDTTGLAVRAVATALGHSLEPAFPAALALAALAVSRGALFPPLEPAEMAMRAPLRQVLVTGWGHWRGEALALVTAA
ncbi:MAG: beta-ketoacyl-ACP synthase [Acetobacteraceae bacterium]